MFNLLLDIDYMIAALVILIALYATSKKDFSTVSRANTIFYYMLMCAIATCVVNILMNVAATYADIFSPFMYMLFRLIFNCGTSGIAYLGYIYARMFQNEKTSRLNVLDWIARSVFALHIILSVINVFTGIIASIDENGQIKHGPLFNINTLVPIIMFIVAVIVVLKKKYDYTNKQRYSIIIYYLITFLFVALELATRNKAPLTMFGIAISLIVLQKSLVSPEYKKLEETLEELTISKQLLEEADKKKNERVRTMHQLMRTASWVLYFDPSGNVTDGEWSDEFIWMLGYTKEEIGDKIYELWVDSLHPDDYDMALKAFTDGMLGSAAFDLEYRLHQKNGDYRWYRGTGELKRDENGIPYSYQGIIQDITEKKISEVLTQEKIAVLDDLQKSEEALKAALIDANQANEAKSRFLSNMSHDIRTPMNAVVGFTDLAIQNIDNRDQVMDYLNKIQVSGNHLLSLINEILDMSRIESGKITLEESRENICDIASSINSMIEGEAHKRGLAYQSKTVNLVHPLVICDALRLRQVLLNCLGNSVKFTNEGSITFTLTELPDASGEKHLYEFRITDTGIGMTKEFLKHVFEPFEREKTSTISRTQGTGLGMSITKSLVDLMNGKIEIESEPNVGTTYVITIPLNEQTQATDTVTDLVNSQSSLIDSNNIPESGVSREEKENFLKCKHFLLVDDNATNRLVAQGLLSAKGLTLDEADDGESAINILRNSAPGDYDAVLMDLQMPVMTGYEATDVIRGFNNELSQIPILAMTANAFEEDKQECIAHGMNGHIAKPFNVNVLIDLLYEILK